MQWWNEFLTWLNSIEGRRVITTAVVPFVAILVSGIIAALIARSASKRLLTYQDREVKAAAVMALIGAGRKATSWSSLGGEEKQRVDNQLNEADIRIRLLPVNGASAAADWAAHELAGMKKNSANFSFQAEQTFVDYRNRLLEWQNKPKRARKLFAFDLEQWRFDDEAADKALVEKQQQWSAKQASEKAAAAAAAATAASATPTVVAPAAISAPAAPIAPEAPTRPAVALGSASNTAASEHTNADSSAAADPAADTTATPSASHDSEDVSTGSTDVYAPPVNAGTVRRRTDPDPSLDEH